MPSKNWQQEIFNCRCPISVDATMLRWHMANRNAIYSFSNVFSSNVYHRYREFDKQGLSKLLVVMLVGVQETQSRGHFVRMYRKNTWNITASEMQMHGHGDLLDKKGQQNVKTSCCFLNIRYLRGWWNFPEFFEINLMPLLFRLLRNNSYCINTYIALVFLCSVFGSNSFSFSQTNDHILPFIEQSFQCQSCWHQFPSSQLPPCPFFGRVAHFSNRHACVTFWTHSWHATGNSKPGSLCKKCDIGDPQCTCTCVHGIGVVVTVITVATVHDFMCIEKCL